MAHAEICPICGGKGVVPNPDPTCCNDAVNCQGCGGLGWVTVQDPPLYIPIEKKYQEG